MLGMLARVILCIHTVAKVVPCSSFPRRRINTILGQLLSSFKTLSDFKFYLDCLTVHIEPTFRSMPAIQRDYGLLRVENYTYIDRWISNRVVLSRNVGGQVSLPTSWTIISDSNPNNCCVPSLHKCLFLP